MSRAVYEIALFFGALYFAWAFGGNTWAAVVSALFVGYSVGRMIWYRRGVKDSDLLHARMYRVVRAAHEEDVQQIIAENAYRGSE